MTNLSSQEIYDITASFLKEKGLPVPRSIWVWSDIFSEEFIEKGIYINRIQVTVFLRIEGKEMGSFKIETSDEQEYRKKLNHIINTEYKFSS